MNRTDARHLYLKLLDAEARGDAVDKEVLRAVEGLVDFQAEAARVVKEARHCETPEALGLCVYTLEGCYQ